MTKKTQSIIDREKKLKESKARESIALETVADYGAALDKKAAELVEVVQAYIEASHKYDRIVRSRSPNYSGSNGKGKAASLLDSVVHVAATPVRYNKDGDVLPGPQLRKVSR